MCLQLVSHELMHRIDHCFEVVLTMPTGRDMPIQNQELRHAMHGDLPVPLSKSCG